MSSQSHGVMGMGEYITCGTMFKHDDNGLVFNRKRNISKDVKREAPDLERQMLNNEYLKILKDLD
jgi:hypothetical protein